MGAPSEYWIASKLTDGLGNRLFQIAAGLGAAELWDREFVFFIPRIEPSVHSDCTIIYKLFPNIRKVFFADSWKRITEPPFMSWKYAQFPTSFSPDSKLVIEGFYQSEKYFPKMRNVDEILDLSEITLPPNLPDICFSKAWFCHIRLGDYLILPHHQVGIPDFLQTCWDRLPTSEPIQLLVFSDSMDKVKVLLQSLPKKDNIQLLFLEDIYSLTPIQILKIMSQCEGGAICSNSTFSWWGAYLSKAKKRGSPIYFPKKWIQYNVPQEDVYSDWMIPL